MSSALFLTRLVGLPYLLLGWSAFLCFAFKSPWLLPWALFVSAGLLIALAAAYRRHMPGAVKSVRPLWPVLVMTLLALLSIRVYSGYDWIIDWVEHHERQLIHRGLQPYDEVLRDTLPFTSRPPLVNAAAATFTQTYYNLTGRNDFQAYQSAMVLLSLLVLLPMAHLTLLIAPNDPKRAMVRLGVLAATCPIVLHQISYPWTKMQAAFFVLWMIGEYVRWVKTRSFTAMLLCATAAGAGVLAHYSSAIPAVLILAHAGWVLLFQPPKQHRSLPANITPSVLLNRLAKALPIVAVAVFTGGVILAPWILWGALVFGKQLVTGTSSANDTTQMTLWENFYARWLSLRGTLLPHPVHMFVPGRFMQAGFVPMVRDYIYAIVQQCLIFTPGLVAGPACLMLLIQAFLLAIKSRLSGLAWAVLAGLVAWVLLGIAVHGAPRPYGLAQVTFVPLALIGVCLISAWATRLSPFMKRALVAGVVLNVFLGITIHLYVQTLLFPIVRVGDHPQGQLLPVMQPDSPNWFAFFNFADKVKYNFQFIADTTAPAQTVAPWLTLLLAFLLMRMLAKNMAPPRLPSNKTDSNQPGRFSLVR